MHKDIVDFIENNRVDIELNQKDLIKDIERVISILNTMKKELENEVEFFGRRQEKEVI